MRWLFVVSMALSQAASPLPRVLVVGTAQGPVRAAFVEALRIQVVARAAVVEGRPLETTLLGERFEEAARLVETENAVLAVWIEEATGGDRPTRDFVVYAVGREPHRALVEVARVRADEAPDTDRALALKVGAFLDSILTAGDAAVDLARAFGKTAFPVDGGPPAVVPGASSAPGLRFVGEAGGLVAAAVPSAAVQGALGVAAGARFGRQARYGEAYAALRFFSDLDVVGPGGRVTVRDRLLLAGARVLFAGERPEARLAIGAFLEAGARFLDADGVSPGGGRGGAARTVLVVVPGAEARLGLGRAAALRLSAGLELDAVRQRFSIDDVPVYDMGRLRPTAALSLVLAAP
jgi:hypothetical protein